MLIQIIENNAEQKCINALEKINKSSSNRNLLQCRFSDIGLKPKADEILPLIKDVLTDRDASLFFCRDGDVFMRWSGYPKETLNNSINRIRSKYSDSISKDLSDNFFKYYDFYVHGEDVRLECLNKLTKIQKNRDDSVISHADKSLTGFSNQMLKSLKANLINRNSRETLEILIVEDQVFSQKLLVAVVGQSYQYHIANNATEAIALYALHAPDIVLLDIELPDMDGHKLAGLFGNADPNSYIIMVTGNHYTADIEKAKENKVKGFIVKPYNKQKILDSIDKFHQLRNKG